MVQSLTFGWQKPDRGDKGNTVLDALESNIEQLDDHDHDGSNSKRMGSFSQTRGSVAVSSTGWSGSAPDFFKDVSFPANYNVANGSEFGKASVRFYFNGGANDKEELFPRYERVDDTTLRLYSPVDNQAYDVVFL